MSVDKLVDSTQLDSDLTSVANAIRTKGGTSAQLAFPNGFVSAINAIPTGGDDREDLTDPKDVDIIDYDGRLLYSYTAQEFLALNSLPANPTNAGLVAQGWNWTLADAKTHVTEHGALVIGQNYTTDDGKTRLYITVPQSIVDYAIEIRMYLYAVTDMTGTVDWGDGSTNNLSFQTGNRYIDHQYQQAGDFIIKITVESGTIRLGYAGSNQTIFATSARTKMTLKKVEVGNGVVGFCRNAFYEMINMTSISIPTTCNSHDTGNDIAMFDCAVLQGIVFPSGTLGQNTKIIGNTVKGNCHLKYIAIPKSMNGFKMNSTYMFSLRKLTFNSYSTSTSLDLYINDASQLTHLVASGTYTTIGGDRVRSSLLKKLIIPETVTSIGNSAFAYNQYMEEIHFKPTTPPTVAAYSFRDIPSTCVIYVPYSEDHSILTAYQNTTNISAYAAQMQEESQ